jgi:tetratricopeptide (TPR) repeat protein
MKKTLTLVFILAFSATNFAQDKIITLKGKVTHLDMATANVEVQSQKTGNTSTTDADGKYEIKTVAGDLVIFSYPGLRDMEIIVEDVTSYLNISMNAAVNQLDEVVVEKTRIKSQNQLRGEYNSNKNLINTAFGILDKDITSFAVRIIDKSRFTLGGIDLASAIQFRFPGIRVERFPETFTKPTIYLRGGGVGFFPAIYDVDGMIFQDFPDFVAVENVERIAILSGLGLVTKYGGKANGGVIVINTKGANTYLDPSTGKPYDLARLRNNVYEGGAINQAQANKSRPDYLTRLYETPTEKEAIAVYKEQAKAYRSSLYYVLDVFGYFNSRWNNTELANDILKEHWDLFSENPLGLKALAYLYQAMGDNQKAHELFKEVFILRPNYAQSYRDLALSYTDIGDFKKAASMYARYDFLVGEAFIDAEDKGFTPLIEREFRNFIELHGAEVTKTRLSKDESLTTDFKGTRLVFEWNDSEAEFDLQFVNPKNHFFTWEHSMFANADRIKEEKIKGYSCEEYLIDSSLKGTWQVNLKYLGNKNLTPTYLKATLYYNYGTTSQRKETKVFKLQLKNVYQELFKVQNSLSLISN